MTIRFVGVGAHPTHITTQGGIYTSVLGANMSQLKGAGNSWKIRVHPPHWNPLRTSHHWFLIPLPLEKIWEVPKPMEKYLPSIDVQWQETTLLDSRRFRVAEFAKHFKKMMVNDGKRQYLSILAGFEITYSRSWLSAKVPISNHHIHHCWYTNEFSGAVDEILIRREEIHEVIEPHWIGSLGTNHRKHRKKEKKNMVSWD